MAPGTRRYVAATTNEDLMSEIPQPGTISQIPQPVQEPTATSGDTCVARKNVRGKTRGVGCERMIKSARSKLHVDFDIEDGVPTGVNAAKLSSEIGIVARNYAPIRVLKWNKVSNDVEKQMITRITTKFDINVNEPHVLKWLKHTMCKRFNGFRSSLHKKFKSFATKEEALQNRPEEIKDPEDWIFLCDLFSSEKFKERSKIYSQNRAKMRCNHRGGSKNFMNHKKDKAKDKGESVGPILLFRSTRWSTEKGWINDQARVLYEKMLELQDETQAGESERSETEICQEVLGKASGYNRNYAFSSTEQHESTDTAELRVTVEQQQKKIQDLEEQIISFEVQKEKFVKLEENQQKMQEVLNYLTKELAHAQTATSPKPVSSTPTTEGGSSSYSAGYSRTSSGIN